MKEYVYDDLAKLIVLYNSTRFDLHKFYFNPVLGEPMFNIVENVYLDEKVDGQINLKKIIGKNDLNELYYSYARIIKYDLLDTIKNYIDCREKSEDIMKLINVLIKLSKEY